MRKLLFVGLVCSVLFACDTGDKKASKSDDTKAKTETKAEKAAPAASSGFVSPRPQLAQVLAKANKVEYLLYNLGMTFESPSETEAQRFYGYLLDQEADLTNCKGSNYDGSITFKNDEGDIVFGMEFNLPQLSNCNRVVFDLDGKKYQLPYNEQGINFYNQVLQLRPQPGQAPPQGQ